MINIHICVLALAVGSACVMPVAQAAETIGYVRILNGDAYEYDQGNQTQVTPNMPVKPGTEIKTGAGASVGTIFTDNTVIALGPDSVFSVRNYAYSPEKATYAFAATLDKGTLAYTAGAIAQGNPMGVTVGTPTGGISVRGNQFAVKVDGQ